MEYELPEDIQMLRQAVREFVNKEVAPIAREIDEEERVPFDVLRKAGDLGLLGPEVAGIQFSPVVTTAPEIANDGVDSSLVKNSTGLHHIGLGSGFALKRTDGVCGVVTLVRGAGIGGVRRADQSQRGRKRPSSASA